MKNRSMPLFLRFSILLAASLLFFWACQLTQNGGTEQKASFAKLYDSLTRYDSVVIVFKDRDGRVLDTVYHARVIAHADIENLPVKNWDGGFALIDIIGFKAGEQVYKVEKRFDGSTDKTDSTFVVIVPGTSLSSPVRELQMIEGDSVPLPEISVKPPSLSDKTILWTIANPDLLFIGDGYVKALKAGSTKITIRLKSDTTKFLSLDITIALNGKIPESLTLSPDTLFLASGGASGRFTVKTVPSSASNAVTWRLSDSLVASVGADGTVRGLKKGTTKIWATSKEKASIYDTAWVIVSEPVLVESVRFLKESTNLFVGGAAESLLVEVLPPSANPEVEFSLTDPTKLALINNRISGLVEGTASIIVKSKENPAKTDTLKVTVFPFQHIDSVRIVPRSLKLYTGGEGASLTCKVSPSSAPQQIQWISSNPTIARVDGTGKVTPMGIGKIRVFAISFVDSLQKDSADVTVKRDMPQVSVGQDTIISLGNTATFLPVVGPQEYGVVTQFKWDLDGDLAWDDSGAVVKAVSFKYDLEKEYLVRFYVRDSEGNDTVVTKKVKAVKGSVVLILSPLNNTYTNQANIKVKWTINDVQQDSSTTALTEGANIITRTAKDATGNTISASVTVTLDTLVPNSPLVHGPATIASTTPTWTWTSGGSGGSGNFRVSLDTENFTTVTEQKDTSYTPVSSLTEAVHTLFVQERDVAGNWSASGRLAIRVDITPPNKPEVKVSTLAITNVRKPVWTWTSGGSAGSGNYRVALDAEKFSSAVEGRDTTYTPANGLTDGPHTLYVQERDAAGNWSMSGSGTITIDSTPPASPKLTGTSPSSSSPKWTWASGGGGSGDFRFHLGAEPTQADTETKTLEYTLASAISGNTYTLYVQERDAAGNWSLSRYLPITYDLTKPTVTITLPKESGTYFTKAATVALSGNSGPKSIVKVAYAYTVAGGTGGSGNATLASDGTWSMASIPLVEGKTAVITITANDAMGNTVDAVLSVMRDNTPPAVPVFTSSTTASPTRNRNPAWYWQGGGGGNGTFLYQLGSNASVQGTATGYTGSNLGDGTYILSVSEMDDAQNWSTAATKTIVVKGDAPLAPNLSVNATLTKAPKWSWSSRGGGNGNFRFKMDAGAYLTTGSNVSTYAPTTFPDGDHTLCVEETDIIDWGAEACATITVDKTAPVVTIASPADGYATNSGTVTVICNVDGIDQTPRSQTLSDGANPITCQSTDAAGNLGTATPRTAYQLSNVIFVKKGVGGGDGSSWQKAYGDLATALSDSKTGTPGTQVWMSSGIYTAPSRGYVVPAGVAVYGGFATSGMPNNINQRDSLSANLTILHPANASDTVMKVVSGFTIRDVIVNSLQFEGPGTLGLYTLNVESMQIANCTFTGFTELAISFYGSGKIISCNVHHNYPSTGSYAVIVGDNFGTDILFDRCTFQQNSISGSVIGGSGGGTLTFMQTKLLDGLSGSVTQLGTDFGLATFRNCTVRGGASALLNFGGIDYDASNTSL